MFDPEMTINSGQMFLWEKHDCTWYGIYGNHILKFSTLLSKDMKSSTSLSNKNIEGGTIEYDSYPELKNWERWVFRSDDDLEKILSAFSNDLIIGKAIKKYYGLRLMRQEPCQCLLSFVCASNTSIFMIRRMLNNLSKKFGRKVIFDRKEFYTFPDARSLYKADLGELLSCGVGYRAKAIKSVAKSIALQHLDSEYLLSANYEDAKEELLKIYGIGNKIADCVLLFSLEQLEAFPIDIWISRALRMSYSWLFTNSPKFTQNNSLTERITPGRYKGISETVRKHFGKYSGYAQQYLYYYIRQDANRSW